MTKTSMTEIDVEMQRNGQVKETKISLERVLPEILYRWESLSKNKALEIFSQQMSSMQLLENGMSRI